MMMTRSVAPLLVMTGVAVSATLLRAQSEQTRGERSFLIVSVKPSNGPAEFPVVIRTPERVRYRHVSLLGLMRFAYGVRLPDEIEGGPSWIDSEFFDIEAIVPLGTSRDEQNLMLQQVLRQRFRLVATTVTKEMPVEALVIRGEDRRLGAHLRAASVDCTSVDPAVTIRRKPGDPRRCAIVTRSRWSPSGRQIVTVHGRAVGMSALAEYLSGRGPVVDRTGLPGLFDFDLEFVSYETEARSAPVHALEDPPRRSVALEEQLGLTLRESRALLPVLVVQSVSRPDPN